MLRIYRVVTTNTASGVGLGSNTVVAKGKIVGVRFSAAGVGGAGGGLYFTELAFNNTATNNATISGAPSEQIIGTAYITFTTTTPNQINGFFPFNRPVQPGNILCINQTLSGTAASAYYVVCYDVLVEE